MGETKQINIKNETYYFYNNQIDLKDVDVRLLKIDKKCHNETGIYYIGYVNIKKIADYDNINSSFAPHPPSPAVGFPLITQKR